MNDNEAKQVAYDAIARYGFTDVDRTKAKMELQYTNCIAYCYLTYDGNISIRFSGTTIKNSKDVNYDMDIKEDVRKLMTRARNAAKKAKEEEAIVAESKNDDLAEYKKIQVMLVEKKIAFALSITKHKYSVSALININGYKMQINNNSGTVGITLSGVHVNVPIELAIEMINMLPAKTDNNNL